MTQRDVYTAIVKCENEDLVAIVHKGAAINPRAIIIVVAGGPQYRAGAHRQFVSLARRLSDEGYTVMRFDLRGMGDSSGAHRGYEQSRPDIAAAIDTLIRIEPSVKEVVLFGECESASGILFYGYRDVRVRGAILVNPWVRTEEGIAQAYVKHYYLNRVTSPIFWKKVFSGEFQPLQAGGSFLSMLLKTAKGWAAAKITRTKDDGDEIDHLPLPARTAIGFRRFTGNILLIMSGRDYIAREFDEVVAMHDAWKGLLQDTRVSRRDLVNADHTFSNAVAKKEAQDAVVTWIKTW
jgi:uncharacterized protein